MSFSADPGLAEARQRDRTTPWYSSVRSALPALSSETRGSPADRRNRQGGFNAARRTLCWHAIDGSPATAFRHAADGADGTTAINSGERYTMTDKLLHGPITEVASLDFAPLQRPQAQETYSFTDFEATGSPEAHKIFLDGFLLHNFEYYSLTQEGKLDEARETLGLIKDQVLRVDGHMSTRNFVNAHSGYIVDTEDWASRFAMIEVDYEGLDPVTIATDQYVQGVRALEHSELPRAEEALARIGGDKLMSAGNRRDMAPRLHYLGLAAQIDLDAGRTEQALARLREAAELESSVPPEYGPAVPVQPMAELLGDVYLSAGKPELASKSYEQSLKGYVGHARSLRGLEKARQTL
jgi:hypothetical protein